MNELSPARMARLDSQIAESRLAHNGVADGRVAEGRASATPQEDEARLLALLEECRIAGASRRGLLLRLSTLPRDLSRPHHLRLYRAALDPLAAADRAALFTLPSDDMVVIWRGPAEAALAQTRTAITALFADDTAFIDIATLALVFDLPEHATALQRFIIDTRQLPPPPPAPPPQTGRPLDLAALSALEQALAHADVSRFARRRQVCWQEPDGRLRLCWEKRYLSVAELAESLAPDRAVQAEPWLFRRLTRTLDRRMLALLAAPAELRNAGPFSLNLNVGSILSPEFLRFDAGLPPSLRGHVVLDLLPADVMADPQAFVFARDFARARGYRLLLRGLPSALLPMFPPSRIGVDLIQLRWSQDLAAKLAALPPSLTQHAVLAGCDTPDVLEWARRQAIRYVQGRLVSAA